MNLDVLMKERAGQVVRFLDEHFDSAAISTRLQRSRLPNGLGRLLESVRYSLLQDGGKRFRPVLAMLTIEALGKPAEMALPLAAAVECIHTYSLIHDDLPAMDNDDVRRGAPTNHKKFEESTAILAGDALLTEAFLFITRPTSGHLANLSLSPDDHNKDAALKLSVVAELSRAAGLVGMVGGQAVDMNSKVESITLDELRTMHRLKTGALIHVSAFGAAILAGANEVQLKQISDYADNLGLAFQVADDLLDHDPKKPEPGSYPALLGPEKTHAFLAELTQHCLTSLASWSAAAEPLRAIATYNQTRLK